MRLPLDAVLIPIDLQVAIDDSRWGPRNNPEAEANVGALLAAWRAARMPVVHVRHESVFAGSPYAAAAPGATFKPEAAPVDGEAIVAKRTNGAFSEGALKSALDALGATHCVFCGVLTNNSVEATVRQAGDLGYRAFVVADACWAVDVRDASGRVWPADDVHRMALANLDGEYAKVVTSAAAIDAAQFAATRRKAAG